MQQIQEPLPSDEDPLLLLPLFWMEVPRPVERSMSRRNQRKFQLSQRGYCACKSCLDGNNQRPRIVSFKTYERHDTKENMRLENVRGRSPVVPLLNIAGTTTTEPESTASATNFDPAAINQQPSAGASAEMMPIEGAQPDIDWMIHQPSPLFAHQDLQVTEEENTSLVVRLEVGQREADEEEEEEDLRLQPRHNFQHLELGREVTLADVDLFLIDEEAPEATSSINNPPSATSDIYNLVQSSIWKDFIAEYIRFSGPFHPHLLIAPILNRRHRDPLSALEEVIYSTALALVAHWNVPHSAIQFALTQYWNVFRYAYLMGRAKERPDIYKDLRPHEVEELIDFPTTSAPVQTFTSAERRLDPDYKEFLVVHAACSNVLCQHVFHQFRKTSDFVVGSLCPICQSPADGEKNLGLVPFPRMPLATALERLLRIPGVEDMLDQAEERQKRDDAFDREKYPGRKVYREASSGSDWSLRSANGDPILQTFALFLRINFGIDWYQPSRTNHARTQSVGPIIGHITNLPLRLRASMPLTLLLGITPGPSEIRGENLHHYLLPLCLELRQARLSGITIPTPKYPQGRLLYVATGAICCDAPARVAITGGPHFARMGDFCIRCTVVKRDLLYPETCVWRVRRSFENAGQVYAERQIYRGKLREAMEEHRRRTAVWFRDMSVAPPPFPPQQREALQKKWLDTPGHPSPLDIIPFFDKELGTTYDPMHMLCMGVVKNFFKNIMFTGDKYRRESVETALRNLSNNPVTLGDSEDASGISSWLNAANGDMVPDESSDEEALADVTACLFGHEETEGVEAQGSSLVNDTLTEAANLAANPPTEGPPNKKRKKGSSKKTSPMLNEAQRIFCHEQMREVIIPPGVETIPAGTFFNGSSGTATAAQWRTFARHYAPFVTIQIWVRNMAMRNISPLSYSPTLTEEELQMLLLVSQITELSLRPVISDRHLALLRQYIKTLQDMAYTTRPAIIKSANLHWLSHMPDDIERYGPPPSYWLSGYERTNKLLKGANNNGHAQDTPLIAYNKFLRVGALRQFSCPEAAEVTPAAACLAHRSAAAYLRAMESINSIDEQKDALAWQEERTESQNLIHRLRPTVMTVKGRVKHTIPQEDVSRICEAWNSDDSEQDRLRPGDQNAESGFLLLEPQAEFYLHFRIGANHFRTMDPRKARFTQLREDGGRKYHGQFFEWRSDHEVIDCLSRRTRVGMIETIFEVTAIGRDGRRHRRQFMKVHMLSPYDATEPYRYQTRIPEMNVWLWKPKIAFTQWVTIFPEQMDCLRPVIIFPVPTAPHLPHSPKVWAIKAVTHK